MALKFLNKKGWHTGSLRNIENVWKAEQKHDAEQKKLEELKKQIHEERERAEFRQLQEQAGLIPKQERLDFLYDSGLAVGKGSGFKALESLPKTDPEATSSSSTSAKQESAVPGALFEDKPQSANDAWRKLHSDPLLMIRQREQEALARVKNNPIQMAMIRKSVEAKKDKGKEEKKQRKKHHRKKSKHRKHSSSENDSDSEDGTLTVEKQRENHHKGSKSDKPARRAAHTSDEESDEGDARRKKYYDKEYEDRRHRGRNNDQQKSKKSYHESQDKEYEDRRHRDRSDDQQKNKKSYYDSQDKEYEDRRHRGRSDDQQKSSKSFHDSQRREYSPEQQAESHHDKRSQFNSSSKPPRHESNNRHKIPVKLSEEERAARLREMQMDAEVHEQQRWKRLKKAADSDAQEAIHDQASSGRSFLDAAQKSVYGAEKGGSSTIEESVRRRTHYLQRSSAADGNAFRRS